uniref:SUEL-type lectin domain-containing protein n=1 Tax=Capitella teleta TaxID=283909 RepID=X2A6E3_CAPTE
MDEAVLMWILLCFNSCFRLCNAATTIESWGTVYTDEFCDYESFSASCPKSQLITILSATYGHMQIGKCIHANIGFLGCRADVSGILDEECAGKQECQLTVTDAKLRSANPCTNGIDVYLRVSYACVNVIPSDQLCNGVTVDRYWHYASAVEDLECEDISVRTAKGQHIEFTYIGLSGDDEEESDGYIIDGDKVLPIMTGRGEKLIGNTNHSRVSLVLPERKFGMKYLIAFRAKGCPDIKAPEGTYIERSGKQAKVVCTFSNIAWHLTCRDPHWLGIIGNCSRPAIREKSVIRETEPQRKLRIHKDIVYLIIVCVTIFLSVFVVTSGLVCLKRARMNYQRRLTREWGEDQTQMVIMPSIKPSSQILHQSSLG